MQKTQINTELLLNVWIFDNHGFVVTTSC